MVGLMAEANAINVPHGTQRADLGPPMRQPLSSPRPPPDCTWDTRPMDSDVLPNCAAVFTLVVDAALDHARGSCVSPSILSIYVTWATGNDTPYQRA